MGNFNYNGLIPAANDPPKNDQPQMQTNAASIASIIAIDHIGFNTPNGGYHTIIHQPPQGSDPAAITGIGQTYPKTVSGDQQLFYESGQGIITQLTGPNAPTPGFNGYTSLPGGIVLQWGFVNGTHSGSQHTFNAGDSGTTSFNIPFLNNIFGIWTNFNFNSNTAGNPSSSSALIVAPDYFNTTTSSFAWRTAGSGSSYTVFYWIAIGN